MTGGFTNCGMICGRTTLLFTAITCAEKVENLEIKGVGRRRRRRRRERERESEKPVSAHQAPLHFVVMTMTDHLAMELTPRPIYVDL